MSEHTYALATLPKLNISKMRALGRQGLLAEKEIELLDGLREKFDHGDAVEQIWAQATPRQRALFKKLQTAGV